MIVLLELLIKTSVRAEFKLPRYALAFRPGALLTVVLTRTELGRMNRKKCLAAVNFAAPLR